MKLVFVDFLVMMNYYIMLMFLLYCSPHLYNWHRLNACKAAIEINAF